MERDEPARHTEEAERGPRLRDALACVPRYVPGRPPTSGPAVVAYKMSSNENPYPPLPGVVEIVAQAAGRMNRYPDMGATRLREAIAARIGVSADEIVPGTGSSGVLSALIAATCESGDDVIFAWRSFEAYPIMVALSGARSVQVPLTTDGRHDLPAMAEMLTPSTRLVLVCSPNNPTGTVVHAGELDAFLDAVPSDVLVVLDEAYVEFIRDPDAPDSLEVYRRHANVVLLRTFSKAYGLAGLRVGYAVARPDTASALRSCTLPFGVSEIASDAAVASLERTDELFDRVETLVQRRDAVATALRAQGYAVPQTQANFVWLPLGPDTGDFAAAADAAGLSVRPFIGEGARCSVDAPEANERLLEVTAAFRERRRSA